LDSDVHRVVELIIAYVLCACHYNQSIPESKSQCFGVAGSLELRVHDAEVKSDQAAPYLIR
jgi:hypothetical protein